MWILELVQGLQTIRCLLESNKDVEMIFRKPKLHIYIIHEVVNQSYEGMLENWLDSPGMNLKPQKRLKHLVNDSGLWGFLNREAPMCLWLA